MPLFYLKRYLDNDNKLGKVADRNVTFVNLFYQSSKFFNTNATEFRADDKLLIDQTYSGPNNATKKDTGVNIAEIERASNQNKLSKRVFDVIFSSLVLFLGSPFFILFFCLTKLTSKGPAIYKQERIGINEHPFYIYKYRSMYVDAEKAGPQLSKHNDPRITRLGKFMRKTRIDELPQFWNVLKGDMSVVGPRPERKFFIEQILEKQPGYNKLLKLKPGITSIGQVKYGYAENIEQMCDRVVHDLTYLHGMSFILDLKIILETLKVMASAKGI